MYALEWKKPDMKWIHFLKKQMYHVGMAGEVVCVLGCSAFHSSFLWTLNSSRNKILKEMQGKD